MDNNTSSKAYSRTDSGNIVTITGNDAQILGHDNQKIEAGGNVTNSNNKSLKQSATCSDNSKVFQRRGDNATVNIEATNTAYLLHIIAEQNRIIDRLTSLLEKTNILALEAINKTTETNKRLLALQTK